MRFFSILASVFLLFFSSALILGVVSGSDSAVKTTISVEAPKVVVLKALIDFGSYQQWCPNITKSEYDLNSKTRETTYLIDGRAVNIYEKIQVVSSENVILFTERNVAPRGYLQNIINEIRLDEHPDGTTEINWEIRYTLRPILSKILNIFFVRPALKSMLDDNLISLKNIIER